jgi:hypothetical protein
MATEKDIERAVKSFKGVTLAGLGEIPGTTGLYKGISEGHWAFYWRASGEEDWPEGSYRRLDTGIITRVASDIIKEGNLYEGDSSTLLGAIETAVAEGAAAYEVKREEQKLARSKVKPERENTLVIEQTGSRWSFLPVFVNAALMSPLKGLLKRGGALKLWAKAELDPIVLLADDDSWGFVLMPLRDTKRHPHTPMLIVGGDGFELRPGREPAPRKKAVPERVRTSAEQAQHDVEQSAIQSSKRVHVYVGPVDFAEGRFLAVSDGVCFFGRRVADDYEALIDPDRAVLTWAMVQNVLPKKPIKYEGDGDVLAAVAVEAKASMRKAARERLAAWKADPKGDKPGVLYPLFTVEVDFGGSMFLDADRLIIIKELLAESGQVIFMVTGSGDLELSPVMILAADGSWFFVMSTWKPRGAEDFMPILRLGEG